MSEKNSAVSVKPKIVKSIMVIPREPPLDTKLSNGGLRRDYTPTPQITKTYLLGMLHDATVRKTTYRIATKNYDFAKILKIGIKKLEAKAWIYKRSLQALLIKKEKIAVFGLSNFLKLY